MWSLDVSPNWRLLKEGEQLDQTTSAQIQKLVSQDLIQWRKVVKAADLKV